MRVEDSFFCTQDDALYARGVGMKNLVIWNNANVVGFALWALFEPDFPNRPEMLIFEDCDILYGRAAWHSWRGGRTFSMRVGGNSAYNGDGNVVFRNIRVEDKYPTYQTFSLTSAGDIPEL